MIADTNEKELDAIFHALADPTRRAILSRLATGEATVNELAEPFSISLPAISRHLKVLEAAGLISRGRDAQYRPCRLEPAPLKDAQDWIGRHQAAWAERFDRLDDYLQRLQEPGSTTHERKDRHR
ncbi:MAG TPA: metalloregulator ArsR/SmtB family transcription factor [Thermomicrobiales bacterium]|nr:metalloregulator ArsR/SmtB family transcription factor [Thermomicrobiales bacterium]